MNFSFCPSCGKSLPQSVRFCPHCGVDFSNLGSSPLPATHSIGVRHIAGVVITSVLVFGGIWKLQSSLIGKAPSQNVAEHAGHAAPSSEMKDKTPTEVPYEDEGIKKLQESVSKSPEDLTALRALSAALWQKLSTLELPPQKLILDLVDTLGSIIKLDPNDSESLKKMAEISFNQKVFAKSVEYFTKYLTLKSDDDEARAEFASALTFSGKFDEAISNLQIILKKDPDNFQALAYSAITYAQMQKPEEAMKYGQHAVDVAPNDEAKGRFMQFLDSLKQQKENAGDVPTSDRPSKPTADGVTLNPVEQMIINHPVTGDKYVKASLSKDGTLDIFLKEFPMSQMPTSMKDSFLNKIKMAAHDDASIRAVRLMDVDSGEEMAKIVINDR